MTHASRQSLTIGASLAALLWMAAPANAETASMTISPAEQTARDDERTRILRAELDKEESLLIAATKRKAERQDRAVAAVEQDEFVRGVIDMFDATLIESSIKPV